MPDKEMPMLSPPPSTRFGIFAGALVYAGATIGMLTAPVTAQARTAAPF